MITWLKYVPHYSMCVHLCRGWALEDELHGVGHGHWSVLMRWPFEGEPE